MSRTFGLTAVALAAGASEGTVRSWFDRGLIPLAPGERDLNGRATPREIPFNTALQVAVTAELVRLGFGAERAARLALSFSDSGTDQRDPGALFEDDRTILVAYPHSAAAQVVPAGEISSIFATGPISAAPAAFVNINEIFRNTAARLGMPASAASRR